MSALNPFVLVVGPTGSGKSSLALRLAQQLNGAILNCDSIQTYERLDIGSAKPTLEERQLTPHFLFDYVPPGEALTAGDFRTRALAVLQAELPQRMVFGVGGSGFYIQALEKGMFDVPKPDPAVEEQVRLENANLSGPEMHRRLAELDPVYAEEINPNDAYRILRALIIIRDSGRRVSDLRAEFKPKVFPYPLLKLGLSPTREELLPVVRARTEAMLARGWLEEVETLLAEGLGEWPALQSVGYRECMLYLRGEITREHLVPLIVEKTLQLAKKQRTWFKRDREIHWLPWHEPEARALALIRAFVDSIR